MLQIRRQKVMLDDKISNAPISMRNSAIPKWVCRVPLAIVVGLRGGK
jgi:hypothetical protein